MEIPSAMKWYVVYTQPLKEDFARQQLEAQGFEVFLPCFQKKTRHARKETYVKMPFFPRYLFVSFDILTKQWRSINGTRGVVQVLSQGEKPTVLPENLVSTLKKEMDERGFLPLSSLVNFTKGDLCHITTGVFKDQEGVFEKMLGSQRVQLLLTLLGRTVRVAIPLADIEETDSRLK